VDVDERRFLSKVDRTGPHHVWTGARSARGAGQLRIDGKLHSAARVAWILANGDVPAGGRILGCKDEPSCVHPDHLRFDAGKAPIALARSKRGGGTVVARSPGTWRISVSAGNDDTGNRRRTSRTVHGTKAEAIRELAVLTANVGDGSDLPSRTNRSLTIDDLVDWYLAFARDERGLEHSTLVGYEDAYRTWIKPHLGPRRASSVQHGDLGRMRRAGLSYSRMNNARALLSGAYKWGKRDRKVSTNPVPVFESGCPRVATAALRVGDHAAV
jgi:hypothetical protein